MPRPRRLQTQWIAKVICNGAQIRAARGLLGWTQARLAQASSLHPNAVAYWEGHDDIPTGVYQTPVACRRIREALLGAGVSFCSCPSSVSG